MSNLKLKRLKKDIQKLSFNAPDYEGFMKGKEAYFYVIGWLNNLSSDLNIKFIKIDDDWLKNKYNSQKFKEHKFD